MLNKPSQTLLNAKLDVLAYVDKTKERVSTRQPPESEGLHDFVEVLHVLSAHVLHILPLQGVTVTIVTVKT